MDLEKDFTNITFNLKDDYEGKVTATLISSNHNTHNRTSVLYIHGFIDYFFQPHLAEAYHQHDYDFYALELRKYGHSLLSHQHPNYCKSLEEYFEEISEALQFIYKKSQKKLVLMGHSTGGLTASLYANYGSDKSLISALILNSPFLEQNLPNTLKSMLFVLAKIFYAINPYSKIDNLITPFYGQSLHISGYGEWNYNLNWKPIYGFPVFFAWFKATVTAQNKIKKNSNICVPILVMFSSKSFLPKKFTPQVQAADVVLNVKHIAAIGKNLGSNVTLVAILDGVHDLFLSKKSSRDLAFNKLFNWLQANEKELK